MSKTTQFSKQWINEHRERIFDQLDQLLNLDRTTLKAYRDTLYKIAQEEQGLPPLDDLIEEYDDDTRLLVYLFKHAACVVVRNALPDWCCED